MGIMDRFIKQEVLQKSQEEVKEEEIREQMLQQQMHQQQQGGMQQQLQQGHIPQQPIPVPQPANVAKETMELYLKPKYPRGTDDLRGNDRFWILTDNEASVEIPTSNSNRETHHRYITDITQMMDLEGNDNCDGLIQAHNLKLHAEVLGNKARSDYGDGLRERVIPSVGIGLSGQWDGLHSKRPEETQKRLFGLGGGK